jgi:hypothetical protein
MKQVVALKLLGKIIDAKIFHAYAAGALNLLCPTRRCACQPPEELIVYLLHR